MRALESLGGGTMESWAEVSYEWCGDVGCRSVRQWCEVEVQSEVERFQCLKVADVFESDRPRTMACRRARGSTGSEL